MNNLNPPDFSRGHTPILSLFLANPGVTLTEAELHAAFPEWTLGQLRQRLGQHVLNGNLLRSGGDVLPKTKALAGASYTAPTPFPRSWRERHTEYERERRTKLRASGQWRPSGARDTDQGETSQEARQSRKAATLQRRVSSIQTAQQGILAFLARHPDEALDEKTLRKNVRCNPALFREALQDLCANGQLHVQYDASKDTGASKYRLPLARNAGRKPRTYGLRHHEVYALAAQRPTLLEHLTRQVQAHLGVTGAVARRLIHDLFHAGHLSFSPVANTSVVRAATPLPAALPTPAQAA